MNIFDIIKQKVLQITHKAILEHFGEDLFTSLQDMNKLPNITLEIPKEEKFGDLATNIAMILAPKLKLAPREIAEKLSPYFKIIPGVAEVTVAGAGFINIRLDIKFWHQLLEEVNKLGIQYGNSNIGNQEKVNIEFVSTNPTGPMHVGHARSAVYGDSIAYLLEKCGFLVTKEYYVNDAGKQIDTLVESLWVRYQQLLGYDIELSQSCYPGEYLIEAAKKLIAKLGNKILEISDKERLVILKEFAVNEMMELIKSDLMSLGVRHDVFTSEQKDIIDSGYVKLAIEFLKSRNMLYYGELEKPKSQNSEDWEPAEQLLFKSTQFGDESDRAVLRSDGSFTYFASDIAYHLHKINRGYKTMLLLLGADHGGYVKRIQSVVSALSDNKAKIHVIINQLVNLIKDSQQLKMSKRAGNFITLRQMINELGTGVIRFAMLMRKNDTVFDLDFNKVLEQSKDNPVFYVHYAHTRAASVINRSIELGIIKEEEFKISLNEIINKVEYQYNPDKPIQYDKLTHTSEISIIKQIALLPKIVESAALSYEPHRISYYLFELANHFHHLWSKGIEDQKLRLIQENDIEISRARVALAYGLASSIGNCLKIMGIEPMLKM